MANSLVVRRSCHSRRLGTVLRRNRRRGTAAQPLLAWESHGAQASSPVAGCRWPPLGGVDRETVQELSRPSDRAWHDDCGLWPCGHHCFCASAKSGQAGADENVSASASKADLASIAAGTAGADRRTRAARATVAIRSDHQPQGRGRSVGRCVRRERLSPYLEVPVVRAPLAPRPALRMTAPSFSSTKTPGSGATRSDSAGLPEKKLRCAYRLHREA